MHRGERGDLDMPFVRDGVASRYGGYLTSCAIGKKLKRSLYRLEIKQMKD